MSRFFDNTKRIKDFARTKEARTILDNNHKGAEVQLFQIGDKVTTTRSATYKSSGIIEDLYNNNNGYWRYIVNGYNYKQSDLIKAGE